MSSKRDTTATYTRTALEELAIYTRISFDRERTQLGVDRQERLCREYAKANGLSVGRVFSDPSTSALRRKVRPGFNALVEAIKAGEVSTLVVWHPDRLTRNTRELEGLIDLLDAHQVKVLSVTSGEYDLSTASGRMAARILGAVATHESEHKGERQKAKNLEMAMAGHHGGNGYRPFGYIAANLREVTPADWEAFANGTSTVDPAVVLRERETLRLAYDRVLAGDSMRSVATWLNDEGRLTTQGHTWHNTRLRQKMTHPYVAGIRRHLGVDYPGNWVPIIEPDQYRRLCAMLTAPERKRRGPAVPYLLSGLVYNAQGERMAGKVYNNRTYVGPGVQCPAVDLDAIVTALLFARLADGLTADTNPDEGARERLTADREAVAAEVAKWDGLAARDSKRLPFDRWQAITAPLHATLDDIDAQLAALSPVASDLAAVVARPGALEAAWPTMPMRTKREALRLVMRRVLVAPANARGRQARLASNPERVRVEWRIEGGDKPVRKRRAAPR